MMNLFDKERCLTDEEIGTLAIRLSAQRRGTVPAEGRSTETSSGLLLFADEPVRSHLEQCSSCRHKLMSETRIYREYFKPIDTSEADGAIRQRIESDLRESLAGHRFKLLFYCPPESSAEEELALAAATETADETALMFAEREGEGDLILKRERDLATGEEVCHLVASDPAFSRNAEVIIDGEIYRADGTGRINVSGNPPCLSEDTIIIVFPAGSR